LGVSLLFFFVELLDLFIVVRVVEGLELLIHHNSIRVWVDLNKQVFDFIVLESQVEVLWEP
jgi:hypothetical protein